MHFTDQTEHDKELDQQLGDLDNKIADLEAENEALKEERTLLKERVRVGNPGKLGNNVVYYFYFNIYSWF